VKRGIKDNAETPRTRRFAEEERQEKGFTTEGTEKAMKESEKRR